MTELLTQLTELGFISLPKATECDTAEAVYDQIDIDPDLAVKVLDALRDWNAPYPVDKDNYDDVLQAWIEVHSGDLHETRQAEKEKADNIIVNLRKRGMCEDGIARATCTTATRLARADGHVLKVLDFHKREGYYLAAVFQLGAEILGN